MNGWPFCLCVRVQTKVFGAKGSQFIARVFCTGQELANLSNLLKSLCSCLGLVLPRLTVALLHCQSCTVLATLPSQNAMPAVLLFLRSPPQWTWYRHPGGVLESKVVCFSGPVRDGANMLHWRRAGKNGARFSVLQRPWQGSWNASCRREDLPRKCKDTMACLAEPAEDYCLLKTFAMKQADVRPIFFLSSLHTPLLVHKVSLWRVCG